MLYELNIIIPGTLLDEQVKEVQEKIVAAIKNLGGEIKETNELSRKRLAFVIKKVRNGIYLDLLLNLEETKTRDLDRALKFIPEVIRFQLAKTAKNYSFFTPKREYFPRRERTAEKTESVVTPLSNPKEAEAAHPKVSMEELDKKLDEILNEKTEE
jgi:small subunit ribosomal protein S6